MYYDKKYPRHVFIETTAKCNLTCSYCPRDAIDNHMELELFKTIVEEASHYGPRSFSLHLFGEPLLWPHILEGIEYIKKCNRRNMVLLTTNGTHLNRFAPELVRLGVDEIIWSWRTEAKFKEETRNLLHRETLRGKTVFRVRILKEVTPQEEIERWSGWPKVVIRSLHNYGGNIETDEYNVPVAGKRHGCYHLWFAPAIAWNGNILICCADPHQRSTIGNIQTMTMAQAWKKMNAIREDHLARKYNGICKDCDVWKNYPDLFYSWQYTT